MLHCHRCAEDIPEGEAVIPQAINGSQNFWFYHPSCWTKCKDEKKALDQRIENVRRMAGFTH